MKKLVHFMIIALSFTLINEQAACAFDGVEVFDIQKGEVVKTIEHLASLQNEVGKWLSSIAGPVGSLHIEPANGIGIKIELAPPLKIDNQWLKGTVTEVVLFVSQTDTYYPTLLIFTKENHTVAFNIQYDLKVFLVTHHLYHEQLNLKNPPHYRYNGTPRIFIGLTQRFSNVFSKGGFSDKGRGLLMMCMKIPIDK